MNLDRNLYFALSPLQISKSQKLIEQGVKNYICADEHYEGCTLIRCLLIFSDCWENDKVIKYIDIIGTWFPNILKNTDPNEIKSWIDYIFSWCLFFLSKTRNKTFEPLDRENHISRNRYQIEELEQTRSKISDYLFQDLKLILDLGFAHTITSSTMFSYIQPDILSLITRYPKQIHQPTLLLYAADLKQLDKFEFLLDIGVDPTEQKSVLVKIPECLNILEKRKQIMNHDIRESTKLIPDIIRYCIYPYMFFTDFP